MAMHTVLVTGYPGLLARHVVRELLASESEGPVRVVLVVPVKVWLEAEQALARLDANARERCELLAGDVSAIDMGLSGVEYKHLVARVTHVHHAAHVSHTGVDRETAESINVRGTREAIELASASPRLRCLVHHSTAFVAGNRAGRVFERELEAGQGFRSVVEETRARAEKLARRYASRVPTIIVRPSAVVGHSMTGEVDRHDGVYWLVNLLLDRGAEFALPSPGRTPQSVQLVPVDFVAKAAVVLGFREASIGRTYHLVDAHALSPREIALELSRLVGKTAPRRFVPSNVARAVLRARGLQRLAPGPLGLLSELSNEATFDDQEARSVLEPLGLTCPSFRDYAAKIVEAVVEKRRASEHVVDETDAPPPSATVESAHS